MRRPRQCGRLDRRRECSGTHDALGVNGSETGCRPNRSSKRFEQLPDQRVAGSGCVSALCAIRFLLSIRPGPGAVRSATCSVAANCTTTDRRCVDAGVWSVGRWSRACRVTGPDQYSDVCRANWMRIIHAKLEGRAADLEAPETQKDGGLIDLMDRLTRSLEGRGSKGKGRGAKEAAARVCARNTHASAPPLPDHRRGAEHATSGGACVEVFAHRAHALAQPIHPQGGAPAGDGCRFQLQFELHELVAQRPMGAQFHWLASHICEVFWRRSGSPRIEEMPSSDVLLLTESFRCGLESPRLSARWTQVACLCAFDEWARMHASDTGCRVVDRTHCTGNADTGRPVDRQIRRPAEEDRPAITAPVGIVCAVAEFLEVVLDGGAQRASGISVDPTRGDTSRAPRRRSAVR